MGRDEALYNAIEQQIIGDDRFVDTIQKKVEEPRRPIKKPKLQDIAAAVAAVTGITEADLVSMSRQREIVLARGVMIGIMRQSGYKLRELAQFMKREISSLAKAGRMAESEAGSGMREKVLQRLNTHFQA